MSIETIQGLANEIDQLRSMIRDARPAAEAVDVEIGERNWATRRLGYVDYLLERAHKLLSMTAQEYEEMRVAAAEVKELDETAENLTLFAEEMM